MTSTQDEEEWILSMNMASKSQLQLETFQTRNSSYSRPSHASSTPLMASKSGHRHGASSSKSRGKQRPVENSEKEEKGALEVQQESAKLEFQREVDKCHQAARQYKEIVASLPRRSVLLRNTSIPLFDPLSGSKESDPQDDDETPIRQHGSLIPLQD